MLRNITTFALFLGLILSTKSQAQSSCFLELNKIFYKPQNLWQRSLVRIGIGNFFNPLEINIIKNQLSEIDFFTPIALKNREEFFLLIYSKLNTDFKKLILNLDLKSRSQREIFFNQLLKINSQNKKQKIFLEEIVSFFQYQDSLLLGKKSSWKDYFQSVESQRANLTTHEYALLIDKMDQIVLYQQTKEHFMKSHFFNLEMIQGSYIQIGTYQLMIRKLDNGLFEIKVPRELIKTPAWNPLDFSHVARLRNSPQEYFLPDRYRVDLGLDGNFYLLDGNHRFQVLDKRDFVLVELAELKTMPMSRFLDVLGINQPNDDELIKIYMGDSTAASILPERIRAALIFEEDELMKSTNSEIDELKFSP